MEEAAVRWGEKGGVDRIGLGRKLRRKDGGPKASRDFLRAISRDVVSERSPGESAGEDARRRTPRVCHGYPVHARRPPRARPRRLASRAKRVPRPYTPTCPHTYFLPCERTSYFLTSSGVQPPLADLRVGPPVRLRVERKVHCVSGMTARQDVARGDVSSGRAPERRRAERVFPGNHFSISRPFFPGETNSPRHGRQREHFVVHLSTPARCSGRWAKKRNFFPRP